MAAETGSGKTGAFCLPILQIVWETLKDLESGGSKDKGPEATLKTCNYNICPMLYENFSSKERKMPSKQ